MHRVVDFRLGKLTGEGGFDSTSGSGVAITETDTGVGVYAADWTSDASNYGVIEFDAVDEVFVYAYLILDTAPSSSGTRLMTILNDGTTVATLDLGTDRKLYLSNNGTSIGSASDALTLGTLYRIGLRQKIGTGADGEIQGYLAERHKSLASFASSSTESFTTQADEVRVGAISGDALDARIGYVALSDRAFPASWLDLHDVVVGPLGFMGTGGPRTHSIGDMVPAYDRAALGERQHDTFQTMSFVSQANTAGGVGQSRLVSADRILTGIADTRFPGYVFPPRKAQAESDGGSASWYLLTKTGRDAAPTLYGTVGNNFEKIGTSDTIAHGGAPIHQPARDGRGNVYWATSGGAVRKLNTSGVVSAVTPEQIGTALHVAAYGRHIWCFGERAVPGLDHVEGKSFEESSGANRAAALPNTPVLEPYSATFAAVYVHSASDAGAAASANAIVNGWELVGKRLLDDASTNYMGVYVYKHQGGGITGKSLDVIVNDEAADTLIRLDHFTGVDPKGTFTIVFGIEEGAGTAVTATGATGGDAQYAGVMLNNNRTIPTEASWTVLEENDYGSIDSETVWRATADSAITWTITGSDTDLKIAFNMAFDETPDADQVQFTILATHNEGTDWVAAPANFSMDLFGSIRASLATAEALWIVTDRGLFRMVGETNQTRGGDVIADVGVTTHDAWELPADDNAGKWIASFQDLIYYPVGATIRRYAPNSSDPNDNRAFWPPDDWATKADQIQALVSNEGGLWWGAAGYLWNFNGRGFHQMAAEPEAGAFDYLYWHQGKLYYKDDPAGYFKFGYVNVRPDILIANGDLSDDDFTTGYVITSSLDFEKVADAKIIRLLESQVTFTKQGTDSGSVAFHYRHGCTTLADPGVGSGGDTGSTWTAWGTHGFADGGYERHVLTTPLQCYRLFVRATLTPGTGGIPVLHFFTVWGQSVMPPVQKIVAQIKAEVGQTNREGRLLWGNADEVRKALRVLKSWRRRVTPGETLYHYVWINDGTDGGDEFLTTFTQLEYALTEQDNSLNRLAWEAAISFEELPS